MPTTAVATGVGVAHLTEPSSRDNLGGYYLDPSNLVTSKGAAKAVLQAVQALVAVVPYDQWFSIISSAVSATTNGYDYVAMKLVESAEHPYEALLRLALPALHRAGYDSYVSPGNVFLYYLTNCGNTACPCAKRGEPSYIDEDSSYESDPDDEEDDDN